MPTLTRRTALAASIGISLGLVAPLASAQDYPFRSIRIVVPFSAGTGLDTITRIMGERLGRELHASVVIENISGSNGIIGTHVVARAPADGYTLLATTQSHYISGMMYNNLPYDPGRFVPVARFGLAQLVVVASAEAGFSNAQGLIAEAKQQPEKLSFASLGSGSSAHMAGALLNSLAGTQLLHVPYKDASQALIDTIRGEPSINFVAMPTAAAQIKGGKLKAIAVTGAKRSASLPDVPTLAESGVTGYDWTTWYGMLAPEGTPPGVVQKVSTAIMKVATSPDFLAALGRIGLDPMSDGASDFTSKLPPETARLQKIVTLTSAKVQ